MPFIRKNNAILIFVGCLIIITIIMLFYLNMSKKGREFYIEKFHENQFLLEKITNSLMTLSDEIFITAESGEIIVRQNGKAIEISKSSLDEENKKNIKKIVDEMNLEYINKTKEILEYVYNSEKDKYLIVYAKDRDHLNSYTNVVSLNSDWYYCYIYNE